MARSPTLREPADPEPEKDRLSQRKRPESGRYLLQVDRQTKCSYATAALAEAAGMTIKTGYPQVRVSVYDSAEGQNTLIELPAASE
jgi:hypothetical protein